MNSPENTTINKVEKLGLDQKSLAELLEVFEMLEKQPSKLKRYINAALRLRQIERQTGKSFMTLSKEYEKMLRESIKLEYLINELREKRRRIEEDLNIYMEQQKVTLDLINKTSRILRELEKYGIPVEEIEKLTLAAQQFKELRYDAKNAVELLSRKKALEDEIANLEATKHDLENQIKRKEEELKEVTARISAIMDVEQSYGAVVRKRDEIEEELRNLNERKTRLEQEIQILTGERSKLDDYKNTVKELENKIERKMAEIQRLDEELNQKREDLKVFEEEIDVARSLFTLMHNPEIASPDELEAIASHLSYIAKVKREGIVKPIQIEGQIAENARAKLVKLVMPAIENEFVPKWFFERVEEKLKEQIAKREELEMKVNQLKQQLMELRKQEQPKPEKPVKREEDEKVGEFSVFRVQRSGEPLKTGGKKAKVVCPYCGSDNLVMMPFKEDLEDLINKREDLMLTCRSCNRDIVIDPTLVIKFY